MQTDKFSQIIGHSLNRTQLILLKPFSLKKCLKLLWIAFLSGSLACGFSGVNLPFDYPDNGSRISTKTNSKQETVKQKSSTKIKKGWDKKIESYFVTQGQLNPNAIRLITIIVLIFLGIMLIFMWLGARFQFVWFEAIVHNSDAIKEPFQKYEKEGEKLFRFYLTIFLLTLASLGSIGFLIYSLITKGYFNFSSNAPWGWIILFILIFFLAMMALAIFVSIFSYIICPQIVNLMALTHCSVRDAWEKIFEIYHKNVKDCWLFILINFGISIVVGTVYVILAFFFIFIFFMFWILAGIVWGTFFSKMSAVIFGILIIFSIPIFLAMTMIICLPVAVFFRSMSLYFLTSLNCGYEPLPLIKPSTTGEA